MVGPEQLGQLLLVDLDAGVCSLRPVPDTGLKYLGGRGFNVWYLSEHLPPSTSPLAPENILMISCGLLTGSSAPASARLHINALSPLTGILGSSNIGGYAGAWLRSCNVFAIAVTGTSKKKVYLHIDASGATLRDASALWGLDTFDTQTRLRQMLEGKNIRVLTIGPSGENRVTFSAVITERDHAAGRTGLGAVMGSKQLKAIVIEKGGHRRFKAGTEDQKKAVRDYAGKIKSAPEFNFFSKYGGAGYIDWVNEFGIMGTKNYSGTGIQRLGSLDGRTLEKNVLKKSGCYKCPIQCKADIRLETRPKERLTRPEFEPIINFGPKCGLDNLDDVIRLDNLCTRLGLDCTSTASVIAFAMDLHERGILTREETGGLDLSWGNAQTMETLIRQMVEDQGLGSILKKGVREAARIIGKGAGKYAAHVKGLELTAYHPAAIMGTALGYAVSSRGGDYNNVYASLEYSWTGREAEDEFGTAEAVNVSAIDAKGYLIKKAVTTNIIIDCLGLCKVPALSLLRSFNLDAEAELAKALTGLDISPKSLADLGWEIASMERRFNIRHSPGDTRDTLPDMFFGRGKHKILKEDFNSMLAEYYRAMGWSEDGVPGDPDEQ